jgi:transposase
MGKIERIEVSTDDRERLRGLARDRNTPRKLVWRAPIVLLAGEGMGAVEVGREVGVSILTVRRWRRRYRDMGVEGLLTDASRPPRRKPLSAAAINKVVDLTLHAKPTAATHWSVHSMARASGLSPGSVQRIWKAHGLKPHLTRSFKLLADPLFEQKVADVVGLYIWTRRKERWLCPSTRKAKSRRSIERSPACRRRKAAPGPRRTTTNGTGPLSCSPRSDAIRREVFHSVADLEECIGCCLDNHNADPEPFTSTATTRKILDKVARAKQALESEHERVTSRCCVTAWNPPSPRTFLTARLQSLASQASRRLISRASIAFTPPSPDMYRTTTSKSGFGSLVTEQGRLPAATPSNSS